MIIIVVRLGKMILMFHQIPLLLQLHVLLLICQLALSPQPASHGPSSVYGLRECNGILVNWVIRADRRRLGEVGIEYLRESEEKLMLFLRGVE